MGDALTRRSAVLRIEPCFTVSTKGGCRYRKGRGVMTAYQQQVVSEYLRHGRKHKLIAYRIGSTAHGVRRVLRNLAKQNRLPPAAPYEWPIP